jgi:hypothetical protein
LEDDEVLGVEHFRRHTRDSIAKAASYMNSKKVNGAVLFQLQSSPPGIDPFDNPIYQEEASEFGLHFVPIGGFRSTDTRGLPEIFACVFSSENPDPRDIGSCLEAHTGIRYAAAGKVRIS